MDLVADFRGLLELEALRVFVHPRLQLLDRRSEFLRFEKCVVDAFLGNAEQSARSINSLFTEKLL